MQNTATQGAYVVTGTQLAVLYDLAEVYVTARVDETDLRDVRIGARVEVVVEGSEDRPLTGVVHDVEDGTAASLSDDPPDNAAAVFDRTTQVVPVRIGVSNPGGVPLLPGMNATVKISRA